VDAVERQVTQEVAALEEARFVAVSRRISGPLCCLSLVQTCKRLDIDPFAQREGDRYARFPTAKGFGSSD
jgi:hypothetical protein